jgi:hypothetical protein
LTAAMAAATVARELRFTTASKSRRNAASAVDLVF